MNITTQATMGPARHWARHWDSVAMMLSGACLVHCLLLPIGAAFLPILASAAQAEWMHWLVVVLAIPTSFFALRHAHHSTIAMILMRLFASAGLTLLALGALGWPSHDLETPMTVAGGLVLASVHCFNFFAKRRGLSQQTSQ